MTDHTKPTSEELQANLDAAQAKLEAAQDTTTDTTDTDDIDEDSEDDTDDSESDTETEDKEVVADTQEDIDYKRKFSESTREAMVIQEKNRKLNAAIEEANSLTEPTEEDLQNEAYKKGFKFDEMSDIERGLFRATIHNERKLSKISEVSQQGKDIEAWNKRVDDFVDDPKTFNTYQRLEGKQEDFKHFAAKETKRGVDFEILVSAFLHNYDETKSKTKHRGKMFETGKGGDKEKTGRDDGKISVTDAMKLRDTNYNEYKRLLVAGKIANS